MILGGAQSQQRHQSSTGHASTYGSRAVTYCSIAAGRPDIGLVRFSNVSGAVHDAARARQTAPLLVLELNPAQSRPRRRARPRPQLQLEIQGRSRRTGHCSRSWPTECVVEGQRSAHSLGAAHP